jgi:hypothetical protein
MSAAWNKGRGLLGPLKPLLGRWTSPPEAQESHSPALCTRTFSAFGKAWIHLEAVWNLGPGGDYRESAYFGAFPDGSLGFYSFTNDGKHSEGRLADGSDVHSAAIAFEAQMPAGLARMIYWPLTSGDGFNFAVESRTRQGWNRFLKQEFRPAPAK